MTLVKGIDLCADGVENPLAHPIETISWHHRQVRIWAQVRDNSTLSRRCNMLYLLVLRRERWTRQDYVEKAKLGSSLQVIDQEPSTREYHATTLTVMICWSEPYRWSTNAMHAILVRCETASRLADFSAMTREV